MLIGFIVFLALSFFFLKDKEVMGMVLSYGVLIPLAWLFQKQMRKQDRKLLVDLKNKIARPGIDCQLILTGHRFHKIYFPILISPHIERWGNENGEINFEKFTIENYSHFNAGEEEIENDFSALE
jgi:hypothetical protein